MGNKNKRGSYVEGEIQNYFKYNLPVVIIVPACSFAGRKQTFAFCNEVVISKCARDWWCLRYDERNAL